ncbi:MAG: non-canonical purine NTP diphosphatase [Tannerellaceae bacterium]|nr:non-canonical purine NTP diphosphatase [Tannerellaceae bacterium]
MKLIFATNNTHKLEEVRAMLLDTIEIVSLKEIGCYEEIPETADTMEGNALLKVQYIQKYYGYACFADDSGLEVEALNYTPGVYSARYSGIPHDSEANMNKLLQEMEGKTNRKGRFRSVIALLLDGKEYLFEGIVKGTITTEKRGKNGFDYDSLFIPEGYEQTFAELGDEVKNKISHRVRAVKQLTAFLSANSI